MGVAGVGFYQTRGRHEEFLGEIEGRWDALTGPDSEPMKVMRKVERRMEGARGPAREVHGDDGGVERSRSLVLPHEETYAAFIETLGLRYLEPHEILRAHRRMRNGVANELPPRRLWRRMGPTLVAADELRHRLGSPLTYITSAYRSPAYNRQCPGAARRSYHTKNQALDLVYECGPQRAFEEAKRMRAEGVFSGGLGRYESFMHLDTRGRNATWG